MYSRDMPYGFLLQRGLPSVEGLTSAPQAFYISGCPPAMEEMLRTCRTWLSPDDQRHARYLEPFTLTRFPARNLQSSVVNVQGTNTCAHSITHEVPFV